VWRRAGLDVTAGDPEHAGSHAPVEWSLVSVVIPARNEAGHIAEVVNAVRSQRSAAREIEVLVMDDGSTDATAEQARAAGARVVSLRPPGERGNAASARNRGVTESRGDPIVFLDADCVPDPGWLQAILDAHAAGATTVGGSLGLPPGLPYMARCDYYCGWYMIHPRARGGWVPHHPPPNLSVRRAPFLATKGYTAEPPFDYTNEERAWQGQLAAAGHSIYFEPRAGAAHYNRPGFSNLMRRNYRWAYTAVEAKSSSKAARLAWLYQHPWLLILGSPLLAIAHTLFILVRWARAGVWEPWLMLPVVFVSRLAYVTGLAVGALQWLRLRGRSADGPRPRPRWE
jgi:glycosyltransferase involved in cell wall biosynthesis